MDILKKIDEQKWNSNYKEDAEKYDKKEREHVLSEELPLTKERLQKIANAKNKIEKNKNDKKQ